MTTLELQEKKAEMVKQGTPPCLYTEKEILQSCEKAIKEYKEGKGMLHSQIKRK